MNDLSRRRDLELRYDGPIPPQHLSEPGDVARRQRRGLIAVYERQAMEFLDSATRLMDEIDEATDATRIKSLQSRLEASIACGTEAVHRAAAIRKALGMPEHPMLTIARGAAA